MYASRDGAPLTDLRQQEIDLLEDGVPQTIETFERVSVQASTPEATRVEPNSIRAGQQMAADPRARVFVLFLDSYHMEAQFAGQLRAPIQRFLEEGLGPDDLVAVLTPEMEVGDLTFSRRTTVTSGLFAQLSEWMRRETASDPIDATERLYQACYPNEKDGTAAEMIRRRRQKRTFDSLNNLAVHLGSLRDERKTVLVATMGWRLIEPNLGLMERKPGEGPPPLAPVDLLRRGRGRDGSDLTNDSMRMACEGDRMALANLDHRERMREITGDANRANVSFYPLTPLRNPAFGGPNLAQLSTLREMATDTDGLAIVNTNNLAEPLQRLVADMSSYYLLGYQSTNAKLDGRFRTIKVSVKRPNVQVRARSGYRAVAAADVITATRVSPPASPRADDPIVRAFSNVASASMPIPLRLRTSVWVRQAAAGSEGLIWVVGELDASTRREAGWASGATAEITVLAPDERSMRSSVKLAAGSSVFAVRIPESGSAAPGRYAVRASVRANGSGDSIAETVTATVADTAAGLGEPLMLRRSPSTGTRYVEAADPRFARNERLRLELPTSSSAPAEARIVDRAGQTTQVPAEVSTRPDASGSFHWIVVDVTLAPFAAADYAVVVTQEGTSHAAGFRVVQ
jgi:VWFA-related protein